MGNRLRILRRLAEGRGVFDQPNGLLRRLVGRDEGRDAEPGACILDTQSIKTSVSVPMAGQGTDAGKKIAGRKRHIGVDAAGLLLAVLVTAASVSDNADGIRLLSNIGEGHPRVVERTFGWLMHHRRLARDYETDPHRSEAMIDLMSRRLTRESTHHWRDS